jgi:hypothetical protein
MSMMEPDLDGIAQFYLLKKGFKITSSKRCKYDHLKRCKSHNITTIMHCNILRILFRNHKAQC